jgi:pimeloyl-ACP methyl ester carboxylesterase
VFRHHDLIAFDQRGTGRSGALRCRELEHSDLFDAGAPAGRCAQHLGAARFRYTTRDSVDDIEAVRVALGYDKIAIYGTSYGTYVALGYALTYPTHVERLVLDSVLPTDGLDPFYRPTLSAIPRVLRSLCSARCGSFTRDPVGDLTRLVGRIGTRGLRGSVVDARGRRRRAQVDRGELFLMLMVGDFAPRLRAAYPAAVTAALDGDKAPLLRLGRGVFSRVRRPPPPRLLSTALFAATLCEEMPLPWARIAPPDPVGRRRQAEATAALIPDSAFLPFDRATLLDSDLLQLCDRWPAAPTAPAFGAGPLPDVPVLLLNGEDDLRTPVEGAQAVAAQFPQAKLVVAPATGHSVLGTDRSGCAERALARFFRDQPVETHCPRVKREVPPTLPPPTALRQVAPARGVAGLRGRAVTAAALTLRDGLDAMFATFTPRAGGLRGGRYRLDRHGTMYLFEVVFVPGVRVSGVLVHYGERRQRGRLRLSGPATPDGVLRIHGHRVSGRLGGQEVHARLSREASPWALGAASATRPSWIR